MLGQAASSVIRVTAVVFIILPANIAYVTLCVTQQCGSSSDFSYL
jgi:hypothetical protein